MHQVTTNMQKDSVKNLCLYHILDGLTDGLTHFSGPSRAALIYAERPEDPIRVYDPQDLLHGHEPRLKELYLDSDDWRKQAASAYGLQFHGQIHPHRNLELSGLISYGGTTRSIFYQMWFTEHHPDMCAIGPTERWLEQAIFLLSHDFVFREALYAATSSYVMRGYATHAVRDYLLDGLNLMAGWDTRVLVYPILDATLGISKTPEEGAWPRGNLVFVIPRDLLQLEFLIRFPEMERPKLKNFKHVRKLLLAVEDGERKLISDGQDILGVATGQLPRPRFTADFRGGYGFLRLAGIPVCSFSDGNFYSSNRRPNLVALEEELIHHRLDPAIRSDLFKIVSAIVNHAADRGFGCTLVLDLHERPIEISGQKMDQPIDLQQDRLLGLAKSLAKVDGALHIGIDLRLHRFACLLDGTAVPGEDLSRGARYNSALRFSARHEKVLVVVVSMDKPISVIEGGVELSARCDWRPLSEPVKAPLTMAEWVHTEPGS
jgi:hypothetical protein